MNWLASEPPSSEDEQKPSIEAKPNEWDAIKQTISYWALRLLPLIGSGAVFAGCNRVGTERGKTFTGSSCVITMGSQPSVLACAGKTEEKRLITEVEIP